MIDIKLVNYVASIIEDIANKGDKAVEYYSYKFDNFKLPASRFKITKERINKAKKSLSLSLKEAIDKAAANIELFHSNELKRLPKTWFIKQKGSMIGQVYSRIEKAGIYIPGGKFPYISTILMTAIPARIAGVKRIVMATPPKNITDEILYTADLCGISDIYQIGGVQAIAALALGTKTVPKVDLICGPGNVYVNEAKRQLFGTVGIDALAGPSEVMILADKSANLQYILNDLFAQAEHDKNAKAILFSDSEELIKKISGLIPVKYKSQIQLIRSSIEKAVGEINRLAPEHLQLCVKNPETVLKKINNAGAVFLGNFTPTAVGDYWAGPSHVLPTGGSARFSSGLSVLTFFKRTSYISYSKDKIKNDAKFISRLAETEGLVDHSNSVKARG